MSIGSGWFIPSLESLRLASVSAGDRFHCEPRKRDQDPSDIPGDHPIRAIFAVLHSSEETVLHGKAARGDVVEPVVSEAVRLYAYSLSCPYLIDALIHYRKYCDVKVIMDPRVHSLTMIKQFIDNIPPTKETGSPLAGLNAIEIRVANVSNHAFTCMNRKQLLTSTLSVYGSYNYSAAARYLNWESFFVS